jgi:hypothetical protein
VTWLGFLGSLVLIGVMFIDAFESMILPRRVRHRYRLARLYYRTGWAAWRVLARALPTGKWRFGFLSVFGPLSLFGLLGVWALGLILGFALLHWSIGTPLTLANAPVDRFGTYVYFSGTTFFTLGYGDVVPTGGMGRALSVAEAGIGFGFLAVALSYLPVLYQAFSRREVTISLLDARAGSPPSAGEFIRRLAEARSLHAIGPVLLEWEHWSSELLESNLSFPVLRYYRSQHDNESWVAALTAILDTTAVLIAGEAPDGYQARLTFAMARHAAVDLVLVAQTAARAPERDRLPPDDLARLREWLGIAGEKMRDEDVMAKALSDLRALYEPFVNVLAAYHEFALPPFVPAKTPVDNWQTSPGMPRSPGLTDLQAAGAREEHDG